MLLVGSSLEHKTAEPILKQVQNYAAHCQRVGGSSSCDVASLRLLRLKSSAPCPKMQAFFWGGTASSAIAARVFFDKERLSHIENKSQVYLFLHTFVFIKK